MSYTQKLFHLHHYYHTGDAGGRKVTVTPLDFVPGGERVDVKGLGYILVNKSPNYFHFPLGKSAIYMI